MKIEITNGPAALEQIHGALEAFWRRNEHVPEHIRNEISIATGEIAANILEHARAVTMWMELRARPDAVEIEFTDAGDPVDVDLAATSMPDEMAERGRGLALARAALRLLHYFRDELGNTGNSSVMRSRPVGFGSTRTTTFSAVPGGVDPTKAARTFRHT